MTSSTRTLRLQHRVVAALVIALLGTAALGTSGAAATQFCKQDAVVRDYLVPLAHLPKVRGFLKSGRLSVGPETLRIYPPRENLVAVRHGEFEVVGELDNLDAAPRPLGWEIISRLEKIDRNGDSVSVVTKKRQHVSNIRSFGSRHFGFPGLVAPGLYLLTLEIRNRSGKKLTQYQEYFRAIKARSELRLAANFTSLAPGDAGYLRIENLGTVFGAYGPGYTLWNERGEQVSVEAIFPGILLWLKAGYAGGCFQFTAPMGLPAGKYRIEAEAGDRLRDTVPLETFVNIS